MSAIGSFFGRLFGGPNTVEKTLDMIKSGADALVLTKEEKIQYNLQGMQMFLEYLKITYDGGYIARRLIGLVVTAMWSLYMGVALYRMDFSIVTHIDEPFMAVMLFYFGAGIATRVSNMINKNDK